MNLLRRLWRRLTYWPVKCEDCGGTGICQHARASHVHSCCGECDRRRVPLALAPPGWNVDEVSRASGYIILGTGVMYRRPWSRRQCQP
jgi:hypothetical protein